MNIRSIAAKTGALFSYRYARAFGMPLSGRSAHTIASDPFTRLRKLETLSFDEAGDTKKLIAKNLAGRYSAGFDPLRLLNFDGDVIKESFRFTDCNQALLNFAMSNTVFAVYAYDELDSRGLIKVPDLIALSKSSHFGVLSRVAADPRTPQSVLRPFVYKSSVLGPVAFANLSLRGVMAPGVLRYISRVGPDEVQKYVASHKNAEPDVIASVLSKIIPMTKQVVDSEEIARFDGETMYVKGISTLFRLHGKWVVDQPEETHFEYSSCDAKRALELILFQGQEKIALILAELEKINDGLAGLIREEMSRKGDQQT
ncbi:MAG: hypothetical protein WC527_05625 [Candidatus Margulisiibacteriota bacterium]